MRRVDVAVVGAGPAGIAAALASAQSGASTLLIDENADIGGQLRWRLTPTVSQDTGLDVEKGPGPIVARALSRSLESIDVLEVAPSTVAWGLFEDNVLGISSEAGADEVQAGSIVLATGSTDVALAFPGWTLPGVLTARAVQIFMHIHRVLPGRRWVILGDTLEAEELADDLERCNAEVIARWSDIDNFRASGTNRLSHVECGDEIHEVDGLAIALGRQPDPELAIQAQAAVTFDLDLGGYTARRDSDCATSVSGLYLAGDAAGIGHLPEIVAEGRLAGLAAAGAERATIEAARETLDHLATERRRLACARARLQATNA